MSQTRESKYVPGYDLFKLLVAVILTIILIALLMRGRTQQISMSVTVTIVVSTQQVGSATLTFPTSPTSTPSTESSQTVQLSTPTTTLVYQPSPTLIPPTETPPTEPPQPVPISTPTQTSIEPPVPVEIPAAPAETSPTPESSTEPNACRSFPSRIHVGDSVRVLLRLNFRINPGLNSPIILTNYPGVQMEVIGGPVCTTKDLEGGPRAYLWWNVRMQNGREGWSAEAPLITPFYFLEPIP